MSKFDVIINKIQENLPVTPQQQNTAAGVAPKPVTGLAQQPQIDPKIVQELIAAKTEQQVQMALQKMQAAQQAQQKTTTTQSTTAPVQAQ
jgi:hypothetical protein